MRNLLHSSLWVLMIILFCNPLQAQKSSKKSKKQKQKLAKKLPYLQHIKSAEEISKVENKFDRLKYQLMGHFSNKEQVEAGATSEPLQEFIVMPIFQDRPNEFWVYLEFFSPSMLDDPIDQRIEQYVRVAPDSFRMEVYYIKEPSKYVNAWKKEKFPRTSIGEDLIRDEVCDLLIAHNSNERGVYRTVPPEEITCEMLTAKGAARYVDLEFVLSDDQYLMWFHFYNEHKQDLKESDKDGLKFKRLEGEESLHLIDSM